MASLSLLIISVQYIIILTTRAQSPHWIEWQHSLWTKHNDLRSVVATGNISNQPSATNIEQILYDSILESIPSSHAQKCQFMHNPNLQKDAKSISDQLSFKFSSLDQFGENIAYFDLQNGPFGLTEEILKDIIEQQWFNQHYDYNYDTNECDTSDCSAYQKILWANTRYMACGVNICPSLSFPNDANMSDIGTAVFIVCNYWPSFDKDELPIYKSTNTQSESVCTDCPSDRNEAACVNGLCTGCPAPNYYFCKDKAEFCTSSKDLCDSDPITALYCPFTCGCSANDLIPDTNCDNLYLSLPTLSPTRTPTNADCLRLGWYDVTELENDESIQCPNGYSLPNVDSVQFVKDECLSQSDEAMLVSTIPILGYQPYGIAIDWPRYDVIGCEWNPIYEHGVIPTANGNHCGDHRQLFVCIDDAVNTFTPTLNPTDNPSVVPTENPTLLPSQIPTMVPTDNPSINPSANPTIFPTEQSSSMSTFEPTENPSFNPSNIPTQEPTLVPTMEPSMQPTETSSNHPTTMTEAFEPFRMFLIFPKAKKHVVEDESEVIKRRLIDNAVIRLYPLHGVAMAVPIQKNVSYGYSFKLDKMNNNDIDNICLSQIVYEIDVSLCDLAIDTSLIEFGLFEFAENEWNKRKMIEYNARLAKGEIVIDLYKICLVFEVPYMIVIDISTLECNTLSHSIYAKSHGKFNIEANDFMIRDVNAITYSNGNIDDYKYWTKVSMEFG